MKNKIDSYKILLVITVFLQTVLLGLYMNEKVGFWPDEVSSYSLANSFYGKFLLQDIQDEENYLDIGNKWITGLFLKKYIVADSENKFNYLTVYDNQLQNTQPPLYYLLIHSICSFFPNHFSKWYALILNLIFFIITQLLLYNVGEALFKSRKLAFFSILLYGFSCASIDNYAFIGPTVMMPMFCLLVLRVFIKSLKKSFSIKLFFELFFITLFGCLTHYLFWLYTFVLTIVFVIFSFKNKNEKKQSIMVLFTILFGFIGVYLAFPFVFEQLNMAMQNKEFLLKTDLPEQYLFAFILLVRKLIGIDFPYCIWVTDILIMGISVYFVKSLIDKNNRDNNIAFLLFIPLVIVILIISLFVNYQLFGITSLKFFTGFYPLITLLIIKIFNYLKKTYLMAFVIIISVISCINGSHLILRDFNQRYSSLEKLLKENNAIVVNFKDEMLNSLLPQLIVSNKVLFLSVNDNLHDIRLPFEGKTYFIVLDDNNKPDLGLPKLLSGYMANHKVEVYDAANIK